MDSPSFSDSPPPVSASSEAFLEFSQRLAEISTFEEKIAFGLAFMRTAISQEGTPHFREFWEARRLVLPFFKGSLNSIARAKLWAEYIELTMEARRLKEILEEQSAFAMEQIDLAIQALEQDVTRFEMLLEQVGEIFFPPVRWATREKISAYEQMQRELELVNTLTSRLNALRKEISKTEMRVRFKVKLFKRLSELGDALFPKRRELIEKVSDAFERDVNCFIEEHFKEGQVVGAPYYALREEIKALQGWLKILTLNSACFTRSRLKLSECWDQIRAVEKEYKKESSEKRQVSVEKRRALQTKIEELKTRTSTLSLPDLDQEIDAILQEMKKEPLHPLDIRCLREELAKLRAPHIEVQQKRAYELEEIAREKLRLKREKIAQVKEEITALSKEGGQLELEVLSSRFERVVEALSQLEISKMEKQPLEKQLRVLKDLVADKKERALLNLSDDERKNLEQLRLVLQQKKERRKEVKEQLENCRKALGHSGLDFEKAMLYQELIEQERERLEKTDAGIEEIEQKIAELEG